MTTSRVNSIELISTQINNFKRTRYFFNTLFYLRTFTVAAAKILPAEKDSSLIRP
jgi:hypothetical protein